MESYGVIVGFFQQGGVFMYPISLILALGLAIAVERGIFLLRMHKSHAGLWQQLQPLLESGQVQEAVKVVAAADNSLSMVLANTLRRQQNGADKEELEAILEEGLMEIVPRLERRTHYLATFANVATLLGLLGTIVGLIQAFTAVANVDPAQKADLLSSSISVAMNTTAYGLIVAIPLLLVYTFLQTRTNALVGTVETISVKFVNRLAQRPQRRLA